MRLFSARPLILFLLAALAVGPLCAQESDDSVAAIPPPVSNSTSVPVSGEPSPVFVEIELTVEGAVAYDSAGGRWAYDFEKQQFVSAPPEAGSERRSSEGGREEKAPPVEVRCTEPKEVDNPSLSAVYIGRDEYVAGDIVAYSHVTVKGWVKGNVRSVNKAVLVTSTGQVDGNVEAPEIEVRNGGRIKGEVIETPVYEIPVEVITSGFSKAGLWVVFGFTLALLLIAFLSLSLASQRLKSMTTCIEGYPVRSALVGLLFILLMPLIIVLVCFTIVGLLVVWLIPVIYFVAFTVGVCTAGFQVLSFTRRRFGVGTPDARLGSLLGIGLYMGLWALTALAWSTDSSAFKTGGLDVWLLVISILSTCYPLLVGVGAAVLTRFGSRTYLRIKGATIRTHQPVPVPAPPPMPEAPTRFEPRAPLPPPGRGPINRPDSGPQDLSEN